MYGVSAAKGGGRDKNPLICSIGDLKNSGPGTGHHSTPQSRGRSSDLTITRLRAFAFSTLLNC